jgi:hypothetical protein
MQSAVCEVPSLAEEVTGVRLGDQRLSKRLIRIVSSLGHRPHDSIPAATANRAEMEATYRFFANEKVTPEAILARHHEFTRLRCAQQRVVLLVQDTTEVDLTRPHQQVTGASSLDHGHRFGGHVHPLMAFDENGVPLGLAWNRMWTHDPAQMAVLAAMTKAEKIVYRRHLPIEDKESLRWLEGVRHARDVADDCPDTTCICIADSESDIFEVFSESRATTHQRPLELLVRACQNRLLVTTGDDDPHIRLVLDAVRASPVRDEFSLELSARTAKTNAETGKRKTSRSARTAVVQSRAATVTLQAPSRPHRKLQDQTLNVVLVEEVCPPEGVEPVQWILITTLPVKTVADIRQCVSWYCVRWQIEVFFKTLKSGCRIEDRQFEYLDREFNFIAVSLIHAWRVLLLCRLGRECPDLPCDVVFDSSEWKAVYMRQHRTTPPADPPRLNEMVLWIAKLGGHVLRSSRQAPFPGAQTLWLGLQRVNDLAHAWNLYGPADTPNIDAFLSHRRKCVVR